MILSFIEYCIGEIISLQYSFLQKEYCSILSTIFDIIQNILYLFRTKFLDSMIEFTESSYFEDKRAVFS